MGPEGRPPGSEFGRETLSLPKQAIHSPKTGQPLLGWHVFIRAMPAEGGEGERRTTPRRSRRIGASDEEREFTRAASRLSNARGWKLGRTREI